MDMVEWILAMRPGRTESLPDRIEIAHESGEYSTVWRNTSNQKRGGLQSLTDIYDLYDGMDLFSSTFKIAAIEQPKIAEGVVLVRNLDQFAADVKEASPLFPEHAIPFMSQAGIGFYAVGIKTGHIYEWDIEESRLSGEYVRVVDILEEWIRAVS